MRLRQVQQDVLALLRSLRIDDARSNFIEQGEIIKLRLRILKRIQIERITMMDLQQSVDDLRLRVVYSADQHMVDVERTAFVDANVNVNEIGIVFLWVLLKCQVNLRESPLIVVIKKLDAVASKCGQGIWLSGPRIHEP